ncbi:MAG: alpha-E domain-containing protein [Desulfurococcales archaeon]|nr:alpha-E domain-containing protein [Desulfurococcales archaeon]
MGEILVPSMLYRLYWTGRYIERIDLLVRSLLAAVGRGVDESRLQALASNLGVEYRGAVDFLCSLLYDESNPSSILHAAKMIRMNMHGLGATRALREANLLVIEAEDRIDCNNFEEVRRHLENLLYAVNKLGKVIEEDMVTPPTPPEDVLREQLLHQQQ